MGDTHSPDCYGCRVEKEQRKRVESQLEQSRRDLAHEADREKILREQIKREIPELIVELKAYWNEQSMFDGFDYITDENFERILNFVAAAIARGKELR